MCSCNTYNDCLTGYACKSAGTLCTTSCTVDVDTCKGACCNAATGTCNAGTTDTLCGADSKRCLNCAANSCSVGGGTRCLINGSGTGCGCLTNSDCVTTACAERTKCLVASGAGHCCVPNGADRGTTSSGWCCSGYSWQGECGVNNGGACATNSDCISNVCSGTVCQCAPTGTSCRYANVSNPHCCSGQCGPGDVCL